MEAVPPLQIKQRVGEEKKMCELLFTLSLLAAGWTFIPSN